MLLAIKLTLLATVFFGLSAPLLKLSQQAGINASQILFINCFSCLLIGIAGLRVFNYQASGMNVRGLCIGLAGTLIGNAAFILINRAFSLDGGNISVIYAITPASILVTIFIGLLFLNEADHVVLSRFLIGMSMVITGIYVINTSIK